MKSLTKLLRKEVPRVMGYHIILLSIVLFSYCGVSHSAPGDVYVDVTMFAWHGQDHYYVEEPVYNQAHPRFNHLPKTTIVAHEYNNAPAGVILRLEVHENFDIGAGYHETSYWGAGPVLGVELHTKRSRGISAGVMLGYAPAYGDAPIDHPPVIVLPVAQFTVPGTPTIGFRVGYMPLGDVPFGVFQATLGF